MNAVFNFSRWLLLLGMHWNEHKKKYLLSLLAIAGLLVMWYSFMLFVGNFVPLHEMVQVVTYYVGLFVAGCLYASFIFSDLAERPRGMHYLLVPASAFEKLLCALLFGTVLFFIGYTIIFYIVDLPMIKVSNSVSLRMAQRDPSNTRYIAEVSNVFVTPSYQSVNFYVYYLLWYFGIQSAFLLGSVYFAKYSFIKTAVSIGVLFLFFVGFVAKVIPFFMPAGDFWDPVRVYMLFEGGNYRQVERAILIPEWLNVSVVFIFKYTFAPLLWVVTYFRLKEKQI